MSPVVKPEPLTTFVVLEVKHRFPIKDGVGQLCARRLWSHDDVMDVKALVDEATLSDVVVAIGKLP